MVQRHRLLTALLGCLAGLVLAALLGAPAASAASSLPRLSACPDRDPGFRCGTLRVPLDHAAAPRRAWRCASRRSAARARAGGC
jgi:hypothetical protein